MRLTIPKTFAVTVMLFLGVLTGLGQSRGTKGKMMHATGTFQVTMGKADASEIGQAAGIGRMTIDKVWSGAVEGTSKGEMLMATEPSGAMVYVAIERMTVKVNGKSGTFVFRHGATMLGSDPGNSVLEVNVVPASGTGELAGIEGTLGITIDASGHHYDFEYTLPGS